MPHSPADTAIELVADAIRRVAASMQTAIDQGHRSSRIDATDVTEVLLAIADEIDPPFSN